MNVKFHNGGLKVSDAIVQQNQLNNRKIKRPIYALYCDGLTGFVNIPDNDVFSIVTTGTLSIIADIQPASNNFLTAQTSADCAGNPCFVNFISKSDTTGDQREWLIRMYNRDFGSTRPNRIACYVFALNNGIGIGSYFQDTVNLPERICVGFKVDTTNTYIYKNGAQRDTDNYTTLTLSNGTAPVRIGGTTVGPSYFYGYIYSVAIFNVALTDNQMLRLANKQIKPNDISGCVLYHDYTLGHAQDLSGNNNNGTLQGNAQFIITDYDN